MKKIFSATATIIAIMAFLVAPLQLAAEEVGDEVFLQGTYIELSVNEAGSLGAFAYAPDGYHPSSSEWPGMIGIVSNGMDYFMPGSPFEGWTLEWSYDGQEYAFYNYGLYNWGWYDVMPTYTADTSAGDVLSAEWMGTASYSSQAVTVTQVISMGVDDRFFTIEVMLENTGSVPLESIEYLRTIDPDNEYDGTVLNLYETLNYVTDEPYAVHSQGKHYSTEISIEPITPGGQVGVSPWWSTSTDEYLDYPYEPTLEDYYIGDSAIGVAYRIAYLDVGESATLSFKYNVPYSNIPAQDYVSPSPFTTLRPAASTLLSRATGLWECISATLPEEQSEDTMAMIIQIQACMDSAASLSNPITAMGALNMACDIMEALNDSLSCGCILE